MRKSSFALLAVFLFVLFASFYTPDKYEAAAVKTHPDLDSATIVKNNIHRVKAVTVSYVIRPRRWDWDGPDNNPRIRIVRTTWTTFNKSGQVTAIEDTLHQDDWSSEDITHEHFTYEKNKLVERTLFQWREDTLKRKADMDTLKLEIVKWKKNLTWRQMEWEDYGQWIVHIDSTTLNDKGQPWITYTHNSMHDSFVEEYVYDAKTRLKYRRLAMKQFWSPPWEMESTTYTYNDDGSHVVLDSVWRCNPHMAYSRRHAGDPKSAGYAWKVLLLAPSEADFDRLENRDQEWFDANGRKTVSQRWQQMSYMWEENHYLYDKEGHLVLETEQRGDKPGTHGEFVVYGEPCLDSIWYSYQNGILHQRKDWHFCNGDTTGKSEETYELNGKQVDPDRVERETYAGPEKEFSFVERRYSRNQVEETLYLDANGLPLKKKGKLDWFEFDRTTQYVYFQW